MGAGIVCPHVVGGGQHVDWFVFFQHLPYEKGPGPENVNFFALHRNFVLRSGHDNIAQYHVFSHVHHFFAVKRHVAQGGESQQHAHGKTDASAGIGLQARAETIKNDLLAFLIDCRRQGKRVMGYGAAAKGNTLMNFAGIRSDLISAVADASPHKQGRYLPGSRIPVVAEDRLREARPDFVVILPWNLRDEISAQLAYIDEWGGRFVTAVPSLHIFDAVAP